MSVRPVGPDDHDFVRATLIMSWGTTTVAAHGVRYDAATLPGRALQFYQRRGFDLVAFHRDAVTRSRATLKPSIPLEVDGVAVRHELELERVLP